MLSRQIEREFREAADRRLHGERLLLEGERVVDTAIAVGISISLIVFDREHAELAARYPQGVAASRDELAKLASTKTAPPVLALGRRPAPRDSSGMAAAAAQGLIALDGVQDPGNAGAIIRTAEAFALGGVVLAREGADPYSPKVVRGSMGAVLSLPVWRSDDLAATLQTLSASAVTLYLASSRGGRDPEHAAAQGAWCLVMGSEAHGLSARVAGLPARTLTLPIAGRVGSLGVAAAAAILIHVLVREGLRRP